MDGGAQQSGLREPPGVGGTEQEGDAGEGPPATDLRRSQPLFIQGSRWVQGWGGAQPHGMGQVGGTGGGGLSPFLPHSRPPAEEEPRASSLPCIPNPFPELCSPSNSPILSSLPQGPPREGTCHVSAGGQQWGLGGGRGFPVG